jgi:hypothetical protein
LSGFSRSPGELGFGAGILSDVSVSTFLISRLQILCTDTITTPPLCDLSQKDQFLSSVTSFDVHLGTALRSEIGTVNITDIEQRFRIELLVPNEIPEPVSLAMLSSGLLTLVLMLRAHRFSRPFRR